VPSVVNVTLHDLNADLHQDGLASELFDELMAHQKQLGLDGPPEGPSIDGDNFAFKLRFSTEDPDKAKEFAWRVLGTAVFAVHARHWIGHPGGMDLLDMTKGLEGKQVAMSSEVVES